VHPRRPSAVGGGARVRVRATGLVPPGSKAPRARAREAPVREKSYPDTRFRPMAEGGRLYSPAFPGPAQALNTESKTMARGINKVILVGNLGNDPETKYTQSGMAVTRISMATTSVRKDREGNQQERTEWHRVVFFGKLGEIAGEYLRKGSSVYVEGSLRYDKYTGQDGVEKYSTDIIADEMQMLGGRGEGGGGGGGGNYGGDRPQRQQAPRQNQNQGGQGGGYGQQRPQQQPQQAPPMDDFADDDIPF